MDLADIDPPPNQMQEPLNMLTPSQWAMVNVRVFERQNIVSTDALMSASSITQKRKKKERYSSMNPNWQERKALDNSYVICTTIDSYAVYVLFAPRSYFYFVMIYFI